MRKLHGLALAFAGFLCLHSCSSGSNSHSQPSAGPAATTWPVHGYSGAIETGAFKLAAVDASERQVLPLTNELELAVEQSGESTTVRVLGPAAAYPHLALHLAYESSKLHPASVRPGAALGEDALLLAVTSQPGLVVLGLSGIKGALLAAGKDGRVELASVSFQQGAMPQTRRASAVSASVAADLAFSTSVYRQLRWSYRCSGDLDQNSEVNVADLTPISKHYKATPAAGGWQAAQVADGDANGEVNSSDISVIGKSYRQSVTGYRIKSAATPEGPFTTIADIGFDNGAEPDGGGFLQFSYQLDVAQDSQYYSVSALSGTEEAPAAAPAVLFSENLPPIVALSADPASSPAPFQAGFDASASSDPDGSIVLYEWDLDNDGVFEGNTGTNPLRQALFSNAGAYPVTVRISDNFGFTATATLEITAQGWAAPVVVDGSNDSGGNLSMTLADGVPVIAYRHAVPESTEGRLMFVRAANPHGSAWNAPQLLDSGSGIGNRISLALVDSRPAIAYQDYGNLDLKYILADDAAGLGWGLPQLLDGQGRETGWYPSLAVVAGSPAVAYVDTGASNLRFIRGADAAGTAAWNSPLDVNSPGDGGSDASLALVNGNPAIAYGLPGIGSLMFVRAGAPDGSVWPAPVTVVSPNSSQRPCLLVVDGNPAICYSTISPVDLMFVRALDADGGAWGSPVTIDSEGNAGGALSLEILDGKPAVAYYESQTDSLKYVQAGTADGSAWGTPEVLTDEPPAPPGTGIRVCCLIEAQGQPAIAYYFRAGRELHYVKRY